MNDHWTIAIPITSGDDFLSFLRPLAPEVWTAFCFSIPIFMLITIFSDYLYARYLTNAQSFEWERTAGFVIRTCLINHIFLYVKNGHKRILVFTWLFSILVIMQVSYGGNLTAMITRPGLPRTIENSDDLVGKEDLPWVMEDGLGVGEYMKATPPGSTLRQLVEKASFLSYDEEWYGACQTRKTWESKEFASICDIYSITDLISNDYR